MADNSLGGKVGVPVVLPNITPIVVPSTLPTVSGLGAGSGTVTAEVSSFGENVMMDITFIKDGTAGTGTADVTITLPTAYPIRTAALTSVSQNTIGWGTLRNTSNQYIPMSVFTDGTLLYFRIGGTANMRGQDLAATTGSFSCKIIVPTTSLIGQAALAYGNGLATSLKAGLQAQTTNQLNIIAQMSSGQAGAAFPQADAVAYSDALGNWRLKFNINETFTTATITSIVCSIAGVSFKSAQAITGITGGSFSSTKSYTSAASGTLTIECSSISTGAVYLSGDVALNSKPTWA